MSKSDLSNRTGAPGLREEQSVGWGRARHGRGEGGVVGSSGRLAEQDDPWLGLLASCSVGEL